MALYAFDGTGNEDREGDDLDSNVLDFFRGYDDPLKNDNPRADRGSLYLKGIGTRARLLIGELASEAFGIGGHRRVRQAMDRLENNIESGDRVVDIVGFSRGAALAISFGNEIARKLPKVAIRFIGVWDVVGQFGLPGEHINAGHDLGLPPSAAHCYHAMALDESRALFPLTRLGRGYVEASPLREVWFRGVHSDVGGGNGNRGMNWIALNWMYENAKRHGLPILPSAVAANLADRHLPQQISANKLDAGVTRTILPGDLLHTSVQLVPGQPGRPHNNPATTLARIDDTGRVLG
jgi:uncharacterized protein (DUF2235 family)